MAKPDFNTLLEINTESPNCTIYRGTKDQLLAAGVSQEHYFPDGKKRTKHHFARYGFDSPNGWSTRKQAGGRYELRIWHEARPKPLPKMDCYTSVAGYKAGLEYTAQLYANSLLSDAKGATEFEMYGTTTYSLDDESIEDIKLATAHLISIVGRARIKTEKRSQRLTLVK